MGLVKHNGEGGDELVPNGNFDLNADGWVHGAPWSWADGKMVFDNSSLPEMVTNGSFSGDASGWTLGARWTYSGNHIVHSAGGSNYDPANTASQDVGAVEGRAYIVSLTVTAAGAGPVSNLFIQLGLQGGGNVYEVNLVAGTQTYTFPFVAAGDDGTLYIAALAASQDMQIDNVSCVDKVLATLFETAGLTNQIVVDVGGSTGTVKVYMGTQAAVIATLDAGSGVNTIYPAGVNGIYSGTGENGVFLVPSDDFDGDVDSIAMKEIFVNPLFQFDMPLEAADYLVRMKVGGTIGDVTADLTD